jgi:anti-sigma regulatory factor (Ser/Thr protein kinase)
MLLASEIVTNAVLHGEGDIELDIVVTDDELRVAVSDESDEVPFVDTNVPPHTGSGRGLTIVNAIATDWGTDVNHGPGKQVWFRLRRPGG